MKRSAIWDVIKVDEISVTPKYLQLIHSTLKGIERGQIKLNDRLPSINEVSFELDVSRDTVEKSYKHLKHIGILESVPSKGYFIKNTEFEKPLKVFLLFNKLSVHKKIIYDSFVSQLGEQVVIDFYIYNNDFGLFKKLIHSKKEEDYSHFVIIPHFLNDGGKVNEVISAIPKDKLVLLDKLVQGVKGEYAAVYENFEKDIYEALCQVLERLCNYNTLKILFPKNSYYPEEILNGFLNFCNDYAFEYKVVHDINCEEIKPGEVYISLMEDDLVVLMKSILSQNLKVGQEVGVISYNETPLKEIILDGITTISTNFCEMGTMAAQLIQQNVKKHVENRFEVTLRNSL
ncbi:regulatory protein, gntR family [Pseudarcicella hirudinis]|uniref:Regulatory protein, gntR family n=1 Tax=Pseudarcicella hirudinis TaxID=1079859 RepID=A0A1I5YWF3_9BACT|nr:GntR family transcriptional regulator [Pseudarcicella hirudinis]SFQ48603.1 regulatory protein, gntR family [Pseudarcicella hirudinis]